ncbi:MAG: MFS transporter [Anaerolineaceae bacterium]|nr:MFS transporter [Anaerolineaceae bacterium]
MINNQGITDTNWKQKFLPIWIAQLFSLLGSGLVQFALVWYITQETGSAAMLATATLVALLPEVLLAPFAGAFVDRLNRRLVMIFADLFIALTTLALVLIFAINRIEIWHIFVVLLLRSAGGVFHWPAMQASTALMVPDKHLARFAGLNQAVRGGLNIVAPLLGALLMTLLQFHQVIAVDVITALIAILPLVFISVPQPERKDSEKILTPRMILSDVQQGLVYLKSWKGMFYLALLAAILNFFLVPTGTLMPLMVTQHFGGDVWQLSILESAIGIGIVAGGLLLGIWGGFKNRIVTSIVGVIGIGLGVFIFGITPANWFWVGVASVALFGFMSPITNGPINAIMQSKIAPEMQGRVLSLISSLCSMMMPLALLIAAPVAEWFGLRVWYWASGLLVMAIGLLAFFVPSVMMLDRDAPQNTPIPSTTELSKNEAVLN